MEASLRRKMTPHRQSHRSRNGGAALADAAGELSRWAAVVHRFKREFRSNSFPLCSPEMAVKHQFGMNSPLQVLGVDCVDGWSFAGVYPISRLMGI